MKKEHILLVLIFFLTFGARLFFAFGTDNFTYESYFDLRQVETIRENGLPIFNDELSYSGRFFIFTPLYHYVLAFFNLFFPIDFVVKVIPNLLASTLVIVVYFLSLKITNNKEASVFSSFISGFIPIFFAETTNSIHVFTLMTSLSFLLIYFFIRIKDNKKYINYFIITLIISTLVHPSSFLVVSALVIYAIIGKLEHLRIQRKELELITFSTVFVVLLYFFIYQKALITYGASIFSQNPTLYFTGVLEMIYKTGLIPFIAGLYIIYRSFFKSRNKYIFILIGFAVSSALALWLRLINFIEGLMFLSVILVLLFSRYYVLFLEYIKKTRFSNFKIYFVILVTLIFIVTSVIPSLYYSYTGLQNIPGQDEISSMEWLRENTKEDAVILAPVKEGFMINQLAKRKNVADLNFLLVADAPQRLEDIETIYTTQFKTLAIELLNKYDVDYIYLSDRARTEYATDELRYFDDTCFVVVYDKGVRIYKSLCKLE